ncbi:DUF2946 family protein [Pollutimonas bauzanensis]|uniref:DUF2946 family protein n=1 Tax=Pollutimonas bauzanensis TaxID=658167 RepID=A0A1M5X4X3_9BURK|nr:DUF2946 family protein [Pollutimonas bauzanensis]SHH94263.1 Protein of unknown function [Pollutimonas bauzanensis]
MDANVIAAMARWPDVADVYGWLSLTESGQWRLHPLGDAWPQGGDAEGMPAQDSGPPAEGHGAGESIISPQILQFIDRNYARDDRGQWFFQNGPQRVYVRLDAAPYIVRTAGGGAAMRLRTHNGLDVRDVHEWWLDDAGKLYAQTEHGPGLIAGRDLAAVLDGLYTAEGDSLLAVLERDPQPRGPIALRPLAARDCAAAAPVRPAVALRMCAAAAIPRKLGFLRLPRPAR